MCASKFSCKREKRKIRDNEIIELVTIHISRFLKISRRFDFLHRFLSIDYNKVHPGIPPDKVEIRDFIQDFYNDILGKGIMLFSAISASSLDEI